MPVTSLELEVAVDQIVLLEPPQALADLAGAHRADALDLFELRLGGAHERLEAVEVLDDVGDHALGQARDHRKDAVAVLLKSVIASPMLKYRGPFVLGLPEEAWFDVDMMQKDMLLALESGRQLDVPLPTSAVANEILTAARGMGLAAQDFAAVFEVLARMSGLESRERQSV